MTFARAERDNYFKNYASKDRVGKFLHTRNITPID
jgi:hypothetical protein